MPLLGLMYHNEELVSLRCDKSLGEVRRLGPEIAADPRFAILHPGPSGQAQYRLVDQQISPG